MKNQSAEKTGGWMIFIAFVLLVLFLTYMFNDVLEAQLNPNQQLNTVISGNYKEVALTRNKYGHYVASGEINGETVTFLVDTGATDIALSETLAQKLNLERGRAVRVGTANGYAKAYRTRLQRVSLGDIKLENVSATILSNASDDQVLLGMAFLKHLELIQKGDQLTIRQ